MVSSVNAQSMTDNNGDIKLALRAPAGLNWNAHTSAIGVVGFSAVIVPPGVAGSLAGPAQGPMTLGLGITMDDSLV
jgi:hypothetical protein